MTTAAKSNAEHVLITGTTSGIGRGLMDLYARNGAKIIAVNRRRDLPMESLYPNIRFMQVDVQDSQGIADLIADLAARNELPTTFILNAGVNKIDNDPLFSLQAFRETININLLGALNFVAPLITRRTQLPETRIVAISSTVNYVANPYCIGYYLSKNALTQSFKVFYEMYRDTNLKFKWVVLGPVLTKITSSSDKFPKIMSRIKDLFSVSVEKTAEVIAGFAASKRACLIFPLRARFLFRTMWLAQQLIPGFYRGRRK